MLFARPCVLLFLLFSPLLLLLSRLLFLSFLSFSLHFLVILVLILVPWTSSKRVSRKNTLPSSFCVYIYCFSVVVHCRTAPQVRYPNVCTTLTSSTFEEWRPFRVSYWRNSSAGLSHSLGYSKICLVLMPSLIGGAVAYPNAQVNLGITTVGICGTPLRWLEIGCPEPCLLIVVQLTIVPRSENFRSFVNILAELRISCGKNSKYPCRSTGSLRSCRLQWFTECCSGRCFNSTCIEHRP